MEGPLPDLADLLPADGEVIGRYAWRQLADAEAGHQLVADDFRERYRAEGRLSE